MNITGKEVASISNTINLNTSFSLTSQQQKLVMYLVSLIHPKDTEFKPLIVPLKDIQNIFTANKWGSGYKRINEMALDLLKRPIIFDTAITIEDVQLKGGVNWVSSVSPRYYRGLACLEFEFPAKLRPFLLKLSGNFTKFYLEDIFRLKSANAIRLYQILKAKKNKQDTRKNVVIVKYSVEELKRRMMLDSQKAYDRYNNFKTKVIKVGQKQLKEHTHIQFEFEEIKEGRKVAFLRFIIYDNTPIAKRQLPEETREENTGQLGLSYSEKSAIVETLEDWGVANNILKQIVANHPEEYIAEKISYTLKLHKQKKIKGSKAAFVVAALRQDYKDSSKQEQLKYKTAKTLNKKKEKELEEKRRLLSEQISVEINNIIDNMVQSDNTALDNYIPYPERIIGFDPNKSIHKNFKEGSPLVKATITNKIEQAVPEQFNSETLKRFRNEFDQLKD